MILHSTSLGCSMRQLLSSLCLVVCVQEDGNTNNKAGSPWFYLCRQNALIRSRLRGLALSRRGAAPGAATEAAPSGRLPLVLRSLSFKTHKGSHKGGGLKRRQKEKVLRPPYFAIRVVNAGHVAWPKAPCLSCGGGGLPAGSKPT